MIKPHYVDFNVAKLLQEKEFEEPVYSYYKENKILYTAIKNDSSNVKLEAPVENLLENYNADKSYNAKLDLVFYSAPEVRHVADWLLQKYKIWIRVDYFSLDGNIIVWDYEIDQNYSTVVEFDETRQFNSLEEAYSAAITYVLENLI
jgi:hypothetical protein